MAAEKDKTQTADGAAGAEDISQAIKDAQASIDQSAADAKDAEAFTTPDATYSRGVPGAQVNQAVPDDAFVVDTYDDALEAGYFGYAPGHANTEGMTVAAVTARDRKLGLPGTGAKGAVVNGDDAPTPAKR
jgi:hypothetical protein